MYGHKHKRVRYHVVGVKPSVLKDYAGMNYSAAQALGFHDVKMHPNMILVDKRLSQKKQKQVIRHEEVEDTLMRQGQPYWKAHKYALKHEK
jgi:hypothetical protein